MESRFEDIIERRKEKKKGRVSGICFCETREVPFFVKGKTVYSQILE